MISDLKRVGWIHKGCHARFLLHAWNCPINEQRGSLGPECKSCWQTVVPPKKTHVDSLTFKLTDWFLSFYSRCWRIPTSNMEIILWVSEMRISSKVFSRPAFWTIIAVDLMQASIPHHGTESPNLLPLKRDINRRGRHSSPLARTLKASGLRPTSAMLWRKRCTFWLGVFFFPFLFCRVGRQGCMNYTWIIFLADHPKAVISYDIYHKKKY